MKIKNVRKLNVKTGHAVQCCICNGSIFLDVEVPVYVKTRRKTELWAHEKCYYETQKNNYFNENE